MIRFLQVVAGLVLFGGALVAGTRRLGTAPPLLPLLDPANGIWAAARAAEPNRQLRIKAGLVDDSVSVTIDDRGVPHIYASQELDAYRALGFVVARDRLFQLEVQTRAAEGTLTELVGPAALPLDREARKLGFRTMLARAAQVRDTTTAAYRSIAAYAEGVEFYLSQLHPRDLPLEYRLLGRAPRHWRAAHTEALLSRMAVVLAFNDPSLIKARAAALVGWPAAEALFPNDALLQDPIQPNAADSTRTYPSVIPPPGPADPKAVAAAPLFEQLALTGSYRNAMGQGGVGSNNWAVAPGRSATKTALLAGDPHLELTLPSVWYQAHLVVPGVLDVSGVTLPGAPWVIIGFNRMLGWSFTNVGSDVNDFYRESVNQADAPTQYRLDGNWKPVEAAVEEYRDPTGKILAIDTLRFTHRGPMWQVDSLWLSMAWTAYDRADHGAEFLAMNRARTVAEFLEGAATFRGPAQNMVVADRRGTIAIRSTGRYPMRPDDGRGDLIKDGSSSAVDWKGSLPLDAYPFALNPPRGFLSSANQQPVDPTVSPRYLGGVWEAPWRAIRINTLLRADSAVTVAAMQRFQVDSISERARAFLPVLLGMRTDSVRRAGLSSAAKAARALLADWDGNYGRENQRAVLFEATMRELARRTWDELLVRDTTGRLRPSEVVLLNLMRDSASIWWDDRRTPAIERRDDIIGAALAAALDSTTQRYGPPGNGWRWGAVHRVSIHHLLRLPALSALDLEVSGGRATLSPSGEGGFGASWRMVLELAAPLRAWAIYPGGQSGNPLSRHYRDLLPRWQLGQLDSLPVPEAPSELPDERIETSFRLTPRRR